jgi:uncharacterized protein (DUF1499 family)
MKRIYKNPVIWLVGAAVIAAGAGVFTLSALNPTNSAETSPDQRDESLRTRRYTVKLNLQQMRQTVEQIVPELTTWGGNWKLAEKQDTDSKENKEIIRVYVPVVFFIDDLQIEMKQEGDQAIVNVRSNSRVGKSDLGENRRHLLQILAKLDDTFGNPQP